MKAKILFISIVFLFGISVAVCLVRKNLYRDKLMQFKTKSEMQGIFYSLGIYLESDILPFMNANEIRRIDGDSIYQIGCLKKNRGQILYINDPESRWREKEKITDLWGHNYHMMATMFNTNVPRIAIIKLWSEGKNGKNEDGSGDDITTVWVLQEGCNIIEATPR